MKMTEMIAEYNSLTGKSIKKFSSRKAGEKQLAKARAAAGITEGQSAAGAKIAKAVKAGWENAKVRKARSARHAVHVTGQGDFKSVATAFKELKLPMGKHVRFRQELVKNGHAKIEEFNFKIKEAAA